MSLTLALLLAGPLALETPVGSPGVAAAVHVLGVLAAVVAAAFVFLGLCAIAACFLSSRISERERRAIRRRPITVEPDPLESYPDARPGLIASKHPRSELTPVTDATPVEHIGGPNDGEMRPLCENGARPNGVYVVVGNGVHVTAKRFLPLNDRLSRGLE